MKNMQFNKTDNIIQNTSFSLNFLEDVFICSLGAYGGPEAHISVFIDQMVVKRKYLTEEELIELVALCSILPGPTSTQTIVAIGYKKGGASLAFFTFLVWALPVLILMTILSFLYEFLKVNHISADILRFIGPMAVGFIILAAFRIGKKVVIDNTTFFLMIFGGLFTYFFRHPFSFPLVLLLGGIVSVLKTKEKDIWNKIDIYPPWIYLILFSIFAIGSLLFSIYSNFFMMDIFEKFYRYGYLVFGGGQVVVPIMHSELVELKKFMTNAEFLTGYGLVQGLPGPMFSFSAYAGGMACRNGSFIYQIIGACLGGIGIFLPGILLIYFIYPVWDDIKKIKAIKVSLKGINAVAGGMIAVTAIILMQKNGFFISNILVSLVTVIAIASKKIPAPLMVLLILILGVIY